MLDNLGSLIGTRGPSKGIERIIRKLLTVQCTLQQVRDPHNKFHQVKPPPEKESVADNARHHMSSDGTQESVPQDSQDKTERTTDIQQLLCSKAVMGMLA